MLVVCAKVCLIDPDEAVHDALRTLLGSSGVDVECFSTAEAFLNSDVLAGAGCACLLVEADLPGLGSLGLIRRLRKQQILIPVIVLASTTDSDIAAEALKAGAVNVFDKPLIGGQLLDRIHSAVNRDDLAGTQINQM